MTVTEFYNKIGGDYESAIGRFRSEALVKRFLPMFLRDPSFSELTDALENDDVNTAFRAAHTLKGVSANLSLSQLNKASAEITEILRAEKLAEAKEYFPDVKKVYDITFNALTQFENEMQ